MGSLELPIMLLLFTVHGLYCVSFNLVEAQNWTCISNILLATLPWLIVLDILFIVASARRRTQGGVGITGWGIEDEGLFD